MNKENNILDMIKQNPEVLLMNKFSKEINKEDKNLIRDIIKETGINSHHYGLTYSIAISVHYQKELCDIIIFLNEKCSITEEKERVSYIINYIEKTNDYQLLINILNNISENHLLTQYISQGNRPIFNIEFMKKLMEVDSILNSEYTFKYKDEFKWTEDYIINNIHRINIKNIPTNLRTNRVLSYIVYGEENNNLSPLNQLFTPLEDDDFPMPEINDSTQWENTIKQLIDKENSFPINPNEDNIFNYFIKNKQKFIHKIKTIKDFANQYLTVNLIYRIILDNPENALLLPYKFLTLRHYAMIVNKDRNLLNKIPKIIILNPDFQSLIKNI